MTENLICVGQITSAHGIKGAVKVRSFTSNPATLAKYSPLYSKDGSQRYDVRLLSVNQDTLIVQINGITDRNEAERLKNKELYADKALFAEPEEDEFFYEDLIGLRVELENGELVGTVVAVYDHGGGDMLEVKMKDGNKTELFAFTKEIFPIVNVTDGVILMCPPEIEYVNDNVKE